MSALVGYHLRFNGEVPDRLSRETVQRLIYDLVAVTGLKKMGPFQYTHTGDGAAAMQGIAESHVSLHQEAEVVFVDIFSCREFNTGSCITILAPVSVRGWSADFSQRGEEA